MKIILDSNVIVSALLSPNGLPAKILNLILSGSVTIVYDNLILSEYINVLGREKFKIDKELL
ncbi:MAG: putative toxin-antitoxin system toxin component, PIN family, partial [Treponema sp.]|nr:putative toxin-antitoxin system toxin component, PIN family [Treponema sp.]